MDPCLSYLEAHPGAMLEELEAFVEHESPSDDKALCDETARWLAERLRELTPQVEILPRTATGDLLIARWPGRQAAEPLLLLCHYDTVFPAGMLRERPFAVRDGRATGPGVFDMKGGYVQALWAMRAVQAVWDGPRRPVVLVSNADEEIGSAESREVIEREARGARAALVFEASQEGRVKTGRKGTGFYRLSIEGKAAHAGLDPDKGVSAVGELARQVLDLERLAAPERGTTLNVGVVAGGTRPNVVAARATAQVDVRFARADEAARIDAAMHARTPHLAGARIEVQGGIGRPPLERTPGVVELYERARALAQTLGFALGEAQVGGASDGNFCSALGIPVLDGLGAVGDGAHADHEWISLADLPKRAALAAHLIATL